MMIAQASKHNRTNKVFRLTQASWRKPQGLGFSVSGGNNMLRKIKATPKKKQNTPADSHIKSFPIVGIGGSAGGLEAFKKLLTNISDKPGVALVFIMHLAPGHKSLLPSSSASERKK